jgi:hypothetical protein
MTILGRDYLAAADSLLPRRGAAQAIIDGAAEAGVGNRHHRDGAAAGPVEPPQHGEEIGGGLHEIA